MSLNDFCDSTLKLQLVLEASQNHQNGFFVHALMPFQHLVRVDVFLAQSDGDEVLNILMRQNNIVNRDSPIEP